MENEDLIEPRFDDVGRWSELKLEILREYAGVYAKVLGSPKNPGFSTFYVDAFAGAGLHISKSTGELIDGSPRIAATIEPRFSQLDLIDLDGSRVAFLKKTFREDPRVRVHHGDCNVELQRVIPAIRFDKYRRGLCLLDPYGLHLNWESIQLAGKMGTVDMILNFPVADMNRNVLWRDFQNVPPRGIERMNRFWGDDSWKTLTWTRKLNLFGDDDWLEKTGSNATITEAFRSRLRNEGGFKFVPEPIAMKNSKGATVYYLFFASQHQVANRIASHIFRKAESGSGS